MVGRSKFLLKYLIVYVTADIIGISTISISVFMPRLVKYRRKKIFFCTYLLKLRYFCNISTPIKLLWKQHQKKGRKKEEKDPPIIKILNSGCFPVNCSWMKTLLCLQLNIGSNIDKLTRSVTLQKSLTVGEGEKKKQQRKEWS